MIKTRNREGADAWQRCQDVVAAASAFRDGEVAGARAYNCTSGRNRTCTLCTGIASKTAIPICRFRIIICGFDADLKLGDYRWGLIRGDISEGLGE